jgi:hypothetical protein
MQQIESIEDHANKSSGKSSYSNEGHTYAGDDRGGKQKTTHSECKELG